jgi:hypothetical protein
MSRLLIPAFLVAALSALGSAPAIAQPPTDLLLPAQASSAATRRDVPARRVRKARVNVSALNNATIRLQLFDDLQPTLTRKKVERPAADKLVWHGADDFGTQAVFAVSKGVLTGTVFSEAGVFEIGLEPDGQYSVAELDPGAFPTDDPMFDDLQFEILADADDFVADSATTATVDTVLAGDLLNPTTIDVMIIWTPAAEAAAGGRAAMDSLALAAVANANLVYSNSLVGARLNLVYAAPVTYTETPSSISTDLNAVRATTDGKIDQVHTLRNTYGADVVTLIGNGYASSGYCGIGGLMSTVSTSFASSAFNVVDRTCAVGNLSYAHEVGHNQGLHHDPANATSTPSSPYAYGYQDPAGLFRTVMSYGSAKRVPFLSSPGVLYSLKPTGTASQDNARTLNANVGTIAAFRSTSGGSTEPPPPTTPTCTYAVSTTSLSFTASGGSKTVTVTATAGCNWAASTSGVTWVGLANTAGSGSASVTVSASANTANARSTTVTVAGKTVGVSQSGVKTKGRVAAKSTLTQ